MTRVYVRCNSGHYFEGVYCPLDGWSSAASADVTRCVAALRERNEVASFEVLRSRGVAETALKRCIIIEFGDDDASFELVAPEGYVVGGVWIPKTKFDGRFL